MKVEVEQLSKVERELSVEVPWETVAVELDEAYRGLSKRARVRGFRPGKVPRKVLEQMYKGAVEGEVINRLVDDLFRKAIRENDLTPIASPEMVEEPQILRDAPFRFKAKVQVKPEVEVKTFKGLEVEREKQEVADSDVDAELQSLREKATVIEQITDRNTVEDGDLAVVDFFGTVDGESFKGGKGINYTVEVGAKQMIPGFEEELIGMKIGDEKNFQLGFPEGQGPDEVGDKPVDWKIDLKEIKRKILPDLDDEFAKDLGEYDTLEELKTKVRENLATRQDAQGQNALREQAMEKLVEANPVDVPPAMVERQLDFMLSDAMRAIGQSKDPKLLEAVGKLREDSKDRAQTQVAGSLLLEAVARSEKIEVSDSELDGRIQELSREYRMSPKQLRSQLQENDQLDGLKYNMVQDKALDLVLSEAKITDVEKKADESE